MEGLAVPSRPEGACTCLAWRPPASVSTTLPVAVPGAPLVEAPPMLAVGTTDGCVLFVRRSKSTQWERAAVLSRDPHVTCLDWAPNHGMPRDMLAVGTSSGVKILGLMGPSDQLAVEEIAELPPTDAAPWRVEFDISGQQMAASLDDGSVRIFKLSLIGTWVCTHTIRQQPEATIKLDS